MKNEENIDENQKRKERWANALKCTIRDMKKYGIECGDDITGILPTKPYEKPLAKKFFKAVKLENLY